MTAAAHKIAREAGATQHWCHTGTRREELHARRAGWVITQGQILHHTTPRAAEQKGRRQLSMFSLQGLQMRSGRRFIGQPIPERGANSSDDATGILFRQQRYLRDQFPLVLKEIRDPCKNSLLAVGLCS